MTKSHEIEGTFISRLPSRHFSMFSTVLWSLVVGCAYWQWLHAERQKDDERTQLAPQNLHYVNLGGSTREKSLGYAIIWLAGLLGVGFANRNLRRHATENERLTIRLHENELRLQAITGAAQDAFLMMDSAGKIGFYNAAAERMFGWTEDEAIGRDLHLLLAPNRFHSAYHAHIDHFRETGEGPAVGKTLELTALHKNGNEFPIEISLSAVMIRGAWNGLGIIRNITRRKRVEEDLRFRNAILSTQQEVAIDGILVVDENERIISYNRRFVEMWGLSPDVVASGVDDVVLNAVVDRVLEPDRFLEKVKYLYQHRDETSRDEIVLKDGGTFDRYSASMTGDDGRYYGRVWYFRDMTASKRILEELRQSEERQRTLFSSSQDALLTLEPPLWRFTTCNKACAAMFGAQDEDEFKAFGPSDLSPEYQPDGRRSSEVAPELIETAMRDGSILFEWRHKRLRGEEFPAIVLLTRVEVRGQVFLQATVRDITKQKQTEETLRRSEEKFRQIVDNIGIGVALISPDMRIIELNRQMRNWFPDIVTENHPICHLTFNSPPTESPCIYCPTVHTFRDGLVHEAMSVTPHSGGTRNFRIVSSPIHDHKGRIIAVIELVEDMTDKRRLEQELNQAHKLEAVGSLAAGIAHEINTPTQYVGDNIEFLQIAYEGLVNLASAVAPILDAGKDGPIPAHILAETRNRIEDANLEYLAEQVPKAIEQSLEGIGRISTIVQAMKEFSHPGVAEKTAVDLNECIRSTATVSRNEWKYVADLELRLDNALPLVMCLAGEFNQAILNMIVNAAHAIADVVHDGSADKGTIVITTRQDGQWAEVCIADSGTGIPVEVRDRIFDPFFTTKGVGRGTGQGLAIARNVIVDKHGGTLTVVTELGKGTTFQIRLPIESAGARKQAAASGSADEFHEF